MLRGLDYREAGGDDVPMIIKVAGRTELDAAVTVYRREAVSSTERERQRIVVEEMGRLEEAGVLESVTVADWSDVRVGDRYDEFVDAVGTEALEPFFEERPATGTDDRVVDLPAICIVHRDGGTPSALYPHWSDGTHHSIEDCTRALCAGDDIENLRPS